jgi:DnaJ-class molecular chaperone
MKKDLYGILGVGREANFKEIKRAYRAAAKRFHPDISPEDEEKFRELQGAYETLSDPAKRDEYDRELLRGRSSAVFGNHDMPHMDRPDTLYEHVEGLFSDFGPFWNGSRIGPFHGPGEMHV